MPATKPVPTPKKSRTQRQRPAARKLQRAGRFSSPGYARSVGAPGDLRGLFAAMRRFLDNRAMLGSTAQGIYGFERNIRDFILWADDRGVTHPQQVSRQVLERYQRWLYHYRKKDGEPLHVRTQRGKITPLKTFFRWLTKTAEIPANPAADLDLPRDIRTIPRKILSAEEAEVVLSLPDTGTLTGLRDRAMMEVLYASGIRRMEIAQLATDDIDQATCALLVRQGKGQKDRLVPLGARALHWVNRYLEEARPQLAWDANDKTLFLGMSGRPLSANGLSTCVAEYIKRADIGKSGGCHLWRHTMATLMLEGGADIRFIQAMLGHSDISSTQIYTQVAIRQLTQVHALTHPGVSLRKAEEERATAPSQAEGMPGPEPKQMDAVNAFLTTLAREAENDGDAQG